MSFQFKLLSLLIVFSVMAISNSCSTISYYHASISGHIDIMVKTEPVNRLIEDDSTSPVLREKLQQAKYIRDYASTKLHLPANDSYSSYADLGRRYVIWNVVAAPEFSLEPKKWCYLIVGCLSYRGYFSERDAREYARELELEGYDVHVGGVTAYSTLGWFDDPLLNTMLQYDNIFLARVIFHELAHQLIYFSDDTEFNEAFADAVAGYGVRQWLLDENMDQELKEFEEMVARETDFYGLVSRYKKELEKLYKSSDPDTDSVRLAKGSIFQNMKSEYEDIRKTWQRPDDYKVWFETGLNNAKLSLVLTYKDLVPEFNRLLVKQDNDIERFYRVVSKLEDCDKKRRREYLQHFTGDIDC